MVDRPEGESVDPLDLWEFRGLDRGASPSPTEEPYNEEDGMAHVKKELEKQDEERRRKWKEMESDAEKAYDQGQTADLQKSLDAHQIRSLVPYKPFRLRGQGRTASPGSGVKKEYQQPSSRQPRTTQTARSTDGGRTGARHHAGGGPSEGWSRFVVKHGRVTFDSRSESAKGTESTVNQIRHVAQGMELGEKAKKSSVNDIGQGMQEMSIDRK
jgi:hypothetical protein